MKIIKYDDMTKLEKKLLMHTEKAMHDTPYNPYSNFFVGAGLLAKTGKIITGSNVENSAYGSTICAERSALVRANAEGYREFKKLAIIAKGEDFDLEEPAAPCGSCRQMIYEASQISEYNIEIILSNTKKSKIIYTDIEELLPLPFGPKDMGVDVKKYQK